MIIIRKEYKKMKKLIAITLAAATMLSVTGCKKETAKKDGEKMVITIANSVAIAEDTPTEKYLEEKYNVEIKTLGFGTDYYDKMATLFASKDIPDVMFMNEKSNWEPLAKMGVLAPIDLAVVEEAAPDHFAHINKVNKALWVLGQSGDTQYAIPRSNGKENNNLMVWNKRWLDAVGVSEVPVKIEEFGEIFDKLVNGDPDGNGKKDTYALTGIGGTYYRQFDWVFGAYGVMPEQWTVEDGKVINGTVSDKSKQALTLLNDWYEKGYISPEFITDVQTDIPKKFGAGLIGTTQFMLDTISPDTPSGAAYIAADDAIAPENLVVTQLPMGPNGDYGDWQWGPLANYVCFGSHLKDDVEKQKVILKMLNDINYDEETALRCQWGEEGKTYKINDPAVGKSSGLSYLGNYGTDANLKAEEGIGFFNLFKCGQSGSNWADYEISKQYLNENYVKQLDEMANSGNYNDALMRASTASTELYATTLQTYKTNTYAEFITGKKSLDEWDAFVKEYMRQGGETLQKEAQEFYDKYVAPTK